jgi:mRNA interferase MazF
VGREQAGQRPAIVLSPHIYNTRAQLCILCPITNQGKGYPFEVPLPDGHEVTGVALADQVKSMSWDVRRAVFVCIAPQDFFDKVKAMVKTILKL